MNNTGLKRDKRDKYYTTDSAVKICMDLFKKHIENTNNDLCIEPSAGNGSFINPIMEIFTKYKFYDIEPEDDKIIKQDYLELILPPLKKGKIHIIGNPPFGRQSSLAIKFIKKSCEFCDSISFILPKSFKKDSLKKYFPLNFHLICEQDLPVNSFVIDKITHDVPCIFQIWIKKDHKRETVQKLIPKNFSFVKKDKNPDISFRRVGIYAGKIDKDKNKSEQSHYFIKFDKGIFNDDLFKKLASILYESRNNTVGPRSISKQDIIKEFNILINPSSTQRRF